MNTQPLNLDELIKAVSELKGHWVGKYLTNIFISCYRGKKSPVTIGLYDIKPVKGKYEYKRRSKEKVARVNSLKFKAGQADPKMVIEVASIRNKNSKEGLLCKVKGSIANLFIPPIKVSESGNGTMLDFGYALYRGQDLFTFPVASNLKSKPKSTKPGMAVIAGMTGRGKSATSKGL